MVKYKSKFILSTLAAVSLSVLSACDSSTSVTSTVDGGSADTPQAVSGQFTFPEIGAALGTNAIEAPAGPVPSFSTRRLISSGNGEQVNYGDSVQLRYDMFSWSTGERVESSDDLETAVVVNAGVSMGIPAALADALTGRNIGDKIQVVFAPGMSDLPENLDNTDAYVLLVELL